MPESPVEALRYGRLPPSLLVQRAGDKGARKRVVWISEAWQQPPPIAHDRLKGFPRSACFHRGRKGQKDACVPRGGGIGCVGSWGRRKMCANGTGKG